MKLCGRAAPILGAAILAGVSVLALGGEARGESPAVPVAVDQAPGVAFEGTNYFVVWQHFDSSTGEIDIYGARVDPDGTVLDPDPGIPISTSDGGQSRPTVAFDGTKYLVVWQ